MEITVLKSLAGANLLDIHFVELFTETTKIFSKTTFTKAVKTFIKAVKTFIKAVNAFNHAATALTLTLLDLHIPHLSFNSVV